jgi:hypothetical protein
MLDEIASSHKTLLAMTFSSRAVRRSLKRRMNN